MSNNGILHISHYDHTHSTITGGAIRYFKIFESWVRHNSEHQTQISIISAHPKIMDSVTKKPLIRIFKYPYIKVLPIKLRYIYSILAIIITALPIRFRYVYTDSAPVLLISGILISLIKNKKLIIVVQLFELSAESIGIQKIYLSLINKFAEKIIVTNPCYLKYFDMTKTWFNGYAIGDNFKIIPNTRKKYDLCFIGSIDTNRKGILEFVKIAIHLYTHNKIQKALIITQSSNLKLIQTEISQHKNLFLIYISINQNEVASLLNESKIFLFPTKAESYGLVIGEALKCGLPVITSDIEELKIWNEIAICTNDFIPYIHEILNNYNEHYKNLIEKIKHNPLLNLNWDDIAKIEKQLIFKNS